MKIKFRESFALSRSHMKYLLAERLEVSLNSLTANPSLDPSSLIMFDQV